MNKTNTSAREKPEYIIAPKDVVEPDMSAGDWENFQRGLDLFHTHKFWAAHEAWEWVWKRHSEPSRIFFQGLIQVTAACHHIQKGVWHGAVKQFNNALFKLEQFPDGFLKVGVARLVADCIRCRNEVERLRPDQLMEFEESLFPVIDYGGKSEGLEDGI